MRHVFKHFYVFVFFSSFTFLNVLFLKLLFGLFFTSLGHSATSVEGFSVSSSTNPSSCISIWLHGVFFLPFFFLWLKGKRKRRIFLYRHFCMPYSQSAQTWITQFYWITQVYLQITQCLPFLRKRSSDGAIPKWGSTHSVADYYLFIDQERMKGWVGLVGWPIADGLPT